MARTRSMRRNNSKKNSRRNSVKSKHTPVGSLSADKARFSAKIGAFICQNQALKDVVGSVDGFEQKLNGRSVNQRVFGVLPFLHLDITREQFKNLMMSPKVNGSLVAAVELLCNQADKGKGLDKRLEGVDFNSHNQAVVGVRDGLVAAVMESIENRWDIRANGKKVLNYIQKVQLAQVEAGKIPKASVRWCGC